MSEKIASEAISRRSMLSFLGLAASSLTILSSVLRPSDAEAYTYGMARRQTRRVARRTGRYTRRAVRDTTELGLQEEFAAAAHGWTCLISPRKAVPCGRPFVLSWKPSFSRVATAR